MLRCFRYKHGIYQWSIIGVPENLLRMDLSSVYPELKCRVISGRIIKGIVIPYYSRAEIVLKYEYLLVIV
ncbi:MltA domain-containing protein [Candidatus Kinetoplastidibacterium blastocrithidiae]|uniref:MltA domain-containing protein n=1 Tax=Candidatus Kinetoplastidibacterium blastocrithidiae TaxID=233181 RepID=UPI0012FF378D|nr:MltA domain-containing protein [Candidatus Kinetoplastibacterium blastocrithidii]